MTRSFAAPLPPDMGIVCYVDDTLILAGGRRFYKTLKLSEVAMTCAVRAIQELGLSVSPAKSEAMWFFDQHRRGIPPPDLCVNIYGEEVQVKLQIKHLGLTIDSQWMFGPHFELLVPKITAASNALCGLLPNIGEAGVEVRQLYEGVVRSCVG